MTEIDTQRISMTKDSAEGEFKCPTCGRRSSFVVQPRASGRTFDVLVCTAAGNCKTLFKLTYSKPPMITVISDEVVKMLNDERILGLQYGASRNRR